MNRIFNTNPESESEMDCGSEMATSSTMETKFINALIESLCEIFEIPWQTRPLFKPTLKAALDKTIFGNKRDEGLLFQYASSQLDAALDRFRMTLDVPREIGVDFDHAPHAKYATLVDWIDKNYERKEIKEDGKGE